MGLNEESKAQTLIRRNRPKGRGRRAGTRGLQPPQKAIRSNRPQGGGERAGTGDSRPKTPYKAIVRTPSFLDYAGSRDDLMKLA